MTTNMEFSYRKERHAHLFVKYLLLTSLF